MAISYKKLLDILEERKETCYTLTKKNQVIGQATWKKINEGGYIDTRTIEALCKYLGCQPGDLLEYVEEEKPE